MKINIYTKKNIKRHNKKEGGVGKISLQPPLQPLRPSLQPSLQPLHPPLQPSLQPPLQPPHVSMPHHQNQFSNKTVFPRYHSSQYVNMSVTSSQRKRKLLQSKVNKYILVYNKLEHFITFSFQTYHKRYIKYFIRHISDIHQMLQIMFENEEIEDILSLLSENNTDIDTILNNVAGSVNDPEEKMIFFQYMLLFYVISIHNLHYLKIPYLHFKNNSTTNKKRYSYQKRTLSRQPSNSIQLFNILYKYGKNALKVFFTSRKMIQIWFMMERIVYVLKQLMKDEDNREKIYVIEKILSIQSVQKDKFNEIKYIMLFMFCICLWCSYHKIIRDINNIRSLWEKIETFCYKKNKIIKRNRSSIKRRKRSIITRKTI